MYKAKLEELTAKSEVFKAVGHPTRLFIVEQLLEGERNVGELTAMIGAGMPTVSKHLSVLENIGMVMSEKRGNCVFYAVKCPCIKDILECLDKARKAKLSEV